MSAPLYYFKVTFSSSHAMHAAAEMFRRYAEVHPVLLISDPPLVLWTDGDIFTGASLYTTKAGVGLLPILETAQVTAIEGGDIPVDAHSFIGDDSHRRDRLAGTIR